MADAYIFTGLSQTGYYSYRDLDSQKMLIADPGGTYRIAAIEPGHPVPPGDGRWQPAYWSPPPDPGPPAAVSIQPVPAATEGGE